MGLGLTETEGSVATATVVVVIEGHFDFVVGERNEAKAKRRRSG